jgi:hypothetical protein
MLVDMSYRVWLPSRTGVLPTRALTPALLIARAGGARG